MSLSTRSSISLRGDDEPGLVHYSPYSKALQAKIANVRAPDSAAPRSRFPPEIIIQVEYPFAIFVRGFPVPQGNYLQAKLQKFARLEEELATRTCDQEASDEDFDVIASLRVIEATYKFARIIHKFLKNELKWNVSPPVSCRIPDLFPKDSLLASKKYFLDESGKSKDLEKAISAVTMDIMQNTFTTTTL